MANGPSFFGENTPDYGLGQDIMRILRLSPTGHVGGGTYMSGGYSSGFAGAQDVEHEQHDYGFFDPFNEGMIATALAKKYGLSGEEQRNLFKSGMFQPLSRSMVNMLAPQQYRTELTQGQPADPTVFSTQPSTDSGMAGSGMASKRALQARQALLKQRAEEIAKMSGNILGQKDSILAQITKWDEDARDAVAAAGVGTQAEDESFKLYKPSTW